MNAKDFKIGNTVACRDGVGNYQIGTVSNVFPGNCKGGGFAMVDIWFPGAMKPEALAVEFADIVQVIA